MESRQILVVEDDSTLRYLIALLARRQGVDADVVSSAADALAALASGKEYALILMDWRLPGMDGLECTRRIRETETGCRHVPIVAMTANVDDSDRNRCLQSGMDDFMTKPFGADQLRATLDRWLSPAIDTEANSPTAAGS